MKFAFYGLLVFVLACKIQENPHYRASTFDDKVRGVKTFGEENLQNQEPGLLQKSFARINALIHSFDEPTPFCNAILQNSPTREDYIRNWQPDGDVSYCPGASQIMETCEKKHNDAFEAGLLCYKSQLFSSDR